MNRSARQIQRQMEDLRGRLDHDVEDVVESTKRMFDWRVYVKKYPWACLGAAAAIGYAVVPRRLEVKSPDPDTLLELAKQNKLVVQANPTPQPKRSVGGAVFHLAANAAVRGLLSYVGQRLGQAGGQVAAQPENAQS